MTDQEIKQAFDEIHMPPALFGKVEDAMNTQKNNKLKKVMKVAVAAVAAFAICLLASNGICYAATGHSLLGKITMYVNGEKVDLKDANVKVKQDKDSYSLTIDDIDGGEKDIEVPKSINKVMIEMSGSNSEQDKDISQNKTNIPEDIHVDVKKEGEKFYLLIMGEGKEKKLDITEDFAADKKADGAFKWDGHIYEYNISGWSNNACESLDYSLKK